MVARSWQKNENTSVISNGGTPWELQCACILLKLWPVIDSPALQNVLRNKQHAPWARNTNTGLYDIFEPTLVQSALHKHPHLGCLFFGFDSPITIENKWNMLAPSCLTSFFAERSKSYICMSLFLSVWHYCRSISVICHNILEPVNLLPAIHQR